MSPFAVSRAGGGGMSYHQIRRSGLDKPTRGVRTERTGWQAELDAFALVLAPHAVFSHTTAARILGLPLPLIDPRPFHVTVPPGKARGSRKGITWHCRDITASVTTHKGFPVTDGLRTWHDLAATLSVPDLVAIADVLLRRRHCSRDELESTAGLRHARRLSRAARLADPGSASPQESLFRVALIEAGLPHPKLNSDIVEQGVWVGCGDFVWEPYRVIADYDGAHHDERGQRHQDAATRNQYAAHGWRHVVITKKMTRSMHVAVDFVAEALRQRGWRG